MAVTMVQVTLEEAVFSHDELCRAARVAPDWLADRLEAGLLAPAADPRSAGRFDGATLRRVRAMVRIERDFDAVPELAALVVDLQEEIDRLRHRLHCLTD